MLSIFYSAVRCKFTAISHLKNFNPWTGHVLRNLCGAIYGTSLPACYFSRKMITSLPCFTYFQPRCPRSLLNKGKTGRNNENRRLMKCKHCTRYRKRHSDNPYHSNTNGERARHYNRTGKPQTYITWCVTGRSRILKLPYTCNALHFTDPCSRYCDCRIVDVDASQERWWLLYSNLLRPQRSDIGSYS